MKACLVYLFLHVSLLMGQPSYELTHLPQKDLLSLEANNLYIDHLPVFSRLFSTTEVRNFLEFGLGEGTRYFLDHVPNVTSVEILTPSGSDAWFQKCLDNFKDAPHWDPILRVLSPQMGKADQLAISQKKDPTLYYGSYLLEYKDLCDELFAGKTYDVAFVDPGVHPRGDLVNELFGRVPVIAAHDTGYSMHEYGWLRISTPFDYVRLDYKQGCGTTLWVQKSRKDILEKLLPGYREQEPKKFRIFFPDMHGDVTNSMRLVCERLGHTLVLPGKSFRPSSPNDGLKLAYEHFSVDRDNLPEHLNGHLEIIENDEILTNPPDIFFINCQEVENAVLQIVRSIKSKDIKIAHYSGNNHTPFNPRFVKNLITADATTAYQFDLSSIHFAFWIPWIDWSALEYTGPKQEGPLGSYLGLHYGSPGFFPARDVYEAYTEGYWGEENPTFTLYDFLPYAEMFTCMEESIGTLHIKNLEGFGYTIIQSLAKGRPVFLKRSYAEGKKLMNWCIEGETSLFFDTHEEFCSVVDRYTRDEKFRTDLQNSAAKQIRRLINNERQTLIFEHFIQNLR